MDGKILHDTVPPEKWCITKKDLHFVRQEIWSAVKRMKLKPILEDTEDEKVDLFDPEDDTIGPNMYNTVRNYIKPLTEEAGSMSWALLRHKDGLKCDLFITHCWAEGAFEFIDKVLTSWPWRARTAWCCIFANPQNLNIRHMLKTPSTSPFAKALSDASHVMAVPTTKVSIYTRVWCAYEAYRAYKEDKIIFTASRSITQELGINLTVGFVFALVSFLVSFYGFPPSSDMFSEDNILSAHVYVYLDSIGAAPLQLCALLLVKHARWSAVINVLGVMVASWSFAMMIYYVKGAVEHDAASDDTLSELGTGEWPYGWLHLSAIFYFAMNEADRLQAMHKHAEAGQLQSSYEEISKCEYTVLDDYNTIMEDIGNKEAEVNRSIKVLISTGMSTPGLRKADACALDLADAANVRLATCWLCFSYWCALTYALQSFYDHRYPPERNLGYEVLIGLDWCIKALCLLTWLYRGLDEKAFLGMAAAKIVMPAIFVFLLFYLGCDLSTEGVWCPEEMPITWMTTSLIVDALVLACAVLGRRRIVGIPWVGMPMAHVLGPGCRLGLGGCWSRLTAALSRRQSGGGDEEEAIPSREQAQ